MSVMGRRRRAWIRRLEWRIRIWTVTTQGGSISQDSNRTPPTITKVMGEPGSRSPEELRGDFRTLPNADTHRHVQFNPDGLFNFRFEYACGNQQRVDPSLPTFRTMLERIEDSIDFAILDGDWMYEELREYTADQWRMQSAARTTPRIVGLAPTIVGVWENYKLYLKRGKNLAAWHREVPSFFHVR